MSSQYLRYWLALLQLPEVGPRTALRWLKQFSDIQALFHASADEMRHKGLSERHSKALSRIDWDQVDKELAWGNQSGCHIIALDDADYPDLLKEVADPPLVLYAHGDKTVLKQRQIAVVGSRNATPGGVKNAGFFAKVLAECGWAVTSGLALGVDGASHRGALAANGVTIGVAGTGLNHVYPRTHRALVEEIVQKRGVVVSEFPLDVPPRAANFPRRNRIIGGLSLGVLVVEAALKSGSLITAQHALEQGREVFAIPGSIHHPLSRGCHHLIRQGAKLVESAEDIFEEMRGLMSDVRRPGENSQAGNREGLDGLCREILEQIGYEITPLDVILWRSGLTAGEVSSILLTLELKGYIQSVPGGYVREILNL
ncbi:hypothetical protein AQUSIP_03620 [Aquicella siphonis]|uniref:Uncharacterized protein n=1 Tax=Aquicella siphonis TaxID=254247 RepID=A0A5E4PFI3_9COXI|nr:DNA-processing protein DprA [Aquicella siphonis]VVC75086.1 hypothetical protein AQUSIP_03620 [Aquicella siphonis]